MTNRSSIAASVLILVVAVALFLGWEWHWRALGHAPMLADDKDLWAQFRQRVVQQDQARSLTVIGASRIQLAWSPADFEQLQPGWTSTSLAINGHYPVAILEDLAADPRFAGLLLVAIDARGLSHWYQDMSAPYVRHYRRDYGPQRQVERRLKNRVQMRLVSAGADFNLVRRLAGWIDNRPPYRPYTTFLPDRTIAADFAKVDIAGLRAGFVDGLAADYAERPPPPPEQWLADLEPVLAAVNTIQERGGRVVFVRMPTADEHLRLDEENYPREQYWDRFSAATTAGTIHFQDWPGLSRFDQPDTSHIDQSDRGPFTAEMVQVLRNLGTLPPSP